MRILQRVNLAALMLCLPAATGAAPAADSGHWAYDPGTHCALFDANLRPGDTVNWIGDCRGGRAEGPGTASFFNNGAEFESYTGDFSGGMAQDGHVIVRWGNGWSYEGTMAAGRFEGEGVLVNDKQDQFQGSWKNGTLNGAGSAVHQNGERYEGDWKNGLPHGYGVLTGADGRRLEGEFVEGKFTGAGAAAAVVPTPVSLDAKAAASMKRSRTASAGVKDRMGTLEPVIVRDSQVHAVDAMPPVSPANLASNRRDDK